jgi:hypothetical protein
MDYSVLGTLLLVLVALDYQGAFRPVSSVVQIRLMTLSSQTPLVV